MESSKIETTKLSLPKGGGAIQGIGETFQPSEFTGTSGMSIPVMTSPCRGFEPQLSVDYSSGAGNGIFGLGFDLSIPKISRKTSKGLPLYDGTDTFILSNADDLIPTGERELDDHRRPTEESHRQVTNRGKIASIFEKTPQNRISAEALNFVGQIVPDRMSKASKSLK